MAPNLKTSHSPREFFSQTSRLHHPKRNAFIFILEASQPILTVGSRDIFIFVKYFFENPPSTFAAICLALCPLKCCSSSGKASPSLQAICEFISFGRSTFPGAEPPAGPLKFRMLQFSCNDLQIRAQTADLISSRSPREKISQTSR